MIARIGKTYSFDAAHKLPNHDGKCANEHGHTYRVTFEVEGEILEVGSLSPPPPDGGMVLDYGVFDDIWKFDLEPLLDHRNLNDSIGGECWPTTAENIAAWCWRKFEEGLGKRSAYRAKLVAVEVSETPKTFARLTEDQ